MADIDVVLIGFYCRACGAMQTDEWSAGEECPNCCEDVLVEAFIRTEDKV